MQEKALEFASHITHPVTVAAFGLVFAASALALALRAKKTQLAWVPAAGLILLGLGPLAADSFLKWRGVYRIRALVLGPDHLPVEDAHLTSSVGGEPKKVEGGWEVDIPPQTRSADARVTLFASVKNAFLSGSSTLVLGRDYYPTTTIQLSSDTSAMLRGVVVDERSRPIAGATVAITGYTDVVTTDNMGNFVLPAHAAEGQIVQVRAQKGRLVGSVSVPAGRTPVELVVKQR